LQWEQGLHNNKQKKTYGLQWMVTAGTTTTESVVSDDTTTTKCPLFLFFSCGCAGDVVFLLLHDREDGACMNATMKTMPF
jgi:hypothetical protein